MKINVKLYGVLRRYRPETAVGAPHHPFTITLPDDARVIHLVEALGMPSGSLNAASINAEAVDIDAVLHDGDQVSLFPPTAGGSQIPN
ncbi:MAG: MoaD/ThiS family protein [Anaerolineales bacterium]|nr:MoaD/ThiS family protein [Anaerolineales bacterium]